ncbi:unnamed protein product, partial [marine sediment metagenome]
MTEPLEGTFEGIVQSAKWTEFEDKDTHLFQPVLSMPVLVERKGEPTARVFPSLFFDDSNIDRGVDAGKTRVRASLEILHSIGLDVVVDSVGSNNPANWPAELEGVGVVVFCKVGDDGRQKCYLNKRGKEAIPESRV